MFAASGPIAAAAATNSMPTLSLPKARYGSCWGSGGASWSSAVYQAQLQQQASVMKRKEAAKKAAAAEKAAGLGCHKEAAAAKRKLWQKIVKLVTLGPSSPHSGKFHSTSTSNKTFPAPISPSARRLAVMNAASAAAASATAARKRSSSTLSSQMKFPSLPTIEEESDADVTLAMLSGHHQNHYGYGHGASRPVFVR